MTDIPVATGNPAEEHRAPDTAEAASALGSGPASPFAPVPADREPAPDGFGVETGKPDGEPGVNSPSIVPRLGAPPGDSAPDPLAEAAVEPGADQLAENIRSLLAAITERPVGAQAGTVTNVNVRIVVEIGTTKLAHVGEVVQSGLWKPVGSPELEDFTNKVLRAIEAVGIETVTHTADEILNDRPSAETLRRAADHVRPLIDMVDRIAETIEPTDPTRRVALRWWILAGAILLAAGVAAVPLISSVAAEVVLTNELALAAAAAALAALLKKE